MSVSTTCTSCGADLVPSEDSPSVCVRCALTFALGDADEQFPTTPLPEGAISQMTSVERIGPYFRSEESGSEATAVAQFLGGMITDVHPPCGGKEITVREMLDRASATVGVHFEEQPRVEAYLRHVMASSYLGLGVRSEAEKHAAAAASLRRVSLGDEDPSRLDSMLLLAHALTGQRKLAEASAVLDELIPLSRRILGEERPETLEAMFEKAVVLLYQGNLTEGEALHRRVYEIRRRILGDRHPDTLKTLYDLACVSANRGDKRAALDWLRKAIESGYAHVDVMSEEPDLASLRGDPEFDRLVAAAKSNVGKNP